MDSDDSMQSVYSRPKVMQRIATTLCSQCIPGLRLCSGEGQLYVVRAFQAQGYAVDSDNSMQSVYSRSKVMPLYARPRMFRRMRVNNSEALYLFSVYNYYLSDY